jgi:zinc-ribbon domain
MTACVHCGRDNEPGAQFCMDCGKTMMRPAGSGASPARAEGIAPLSRTPVAIPLPTNQKDDAMALGWARRGPGLDPALLACQPIVRRAGGP